MDGLKNYLFSFKILLLFLPCLPIDNAEPILLVIINQKPCASLCFWPRKSPRIAHAGRFVKFTLFHRLLLKARTFAGPGYYTSRTFKMHELPLGR
jgi:hypothetical protein